MIDRYLFQYLGSRGNKSRVSVFIFHRILSGRDDFRPFEPDVRRFQEICLFIRNHYTVLSLSDAVERMRHEQLPKSAACITFDDGYRDNFEFALPILRQHDLVATFFIATSYLDGGRMWNDTVLESFRNISAGPIDLSRIGLGNPVLNTSQSRIEVAEKVIRAVKYRAPSERTSVCGELCAIAGLSPRSGLMMTTDQVRSLSNSGMEIGAHTHTHPILNSLPANGAVEEIRVGRDALQDIIRQPIAVFAYPNGQPGRDYNASHVEMVRAAGFAAAVTTVRGVATSSSDPYQLPRFTPWDQSMWWFAVRCGLELYKT